MRYLFCALVALSLGIDGTQAAASDRYAGPIIDMHVHAHGDASVPHRLCFPAPCKGEPTKAQDGDDVRVQTIAEMRRLNVVLGYLSVGEVDAWRAEAPDLFLPALALGHPNEIDIERMIKDLQSGRIQALGEVGVQYAGIPIDDPSMDPFFAFAYEHDLPVLVHNAGLGGAPDFPTHLGNPQRLAPILVKYPGLRLFVENAGWPFLEDMVSVMYQYPSVYVDVSTILHLTPRKVAQRHIKGLVDAGLGSRIMFGSDQMKWPEVIGVAIETIETSEFLTTDQKDDIFYNNAARFLRLSDEEIAGHHALIAAKDE